MAKVRRRHVKQLQTVGFVDKGDDPSAEIVFFKRAEPTAKRIMRRGSKFVVVSDDGDVLGEHNSRAEAEAQLRTVETSKDSDVDKDETRTVLTRIEDAINKLLGKQSGNPNDGTQEGSMSFDIEKLDDEVRAEFEKLQSKVAELTEKLEDGEEEDILKDVPDEVRKRIEAAEKAAEESATRLQKIEDERERERFMRKATDIGLPADDFADTLRKAAGALDDEEYAKLEQKIKALTEQVRESDLFKEIGNYGSGEPTSTQAEVNKLMDEVRKEHPGYSEQRARGVVMKNRPDLRRKLEDERIKRVAHLKSED